MKLTHELFIEIISKLKLPVLGGVCHGYAMVLSQFICSKNKDEFFYFLDKIRGFDSSEQLLLALEQDNSESYELKNFFTEIAWYQNPQNHKELLGGIYQQQNIEIISKKLSSRKSALFPHVIKQIPLEVVYKKPFILNKIELIDYLNDLQKQLEKTPDVPAAIHLGNDQHKVCIQFDFETNRWVNSDIALLEKESYQQDSYSTSELADSIFHSLSDVDEDGTPSEYTGFALSIVVSHEQAAKLQVIFSNANLKAPNLEEQLLRTNSRQINLLQLSEANSCTDDFIRILSQNNIDPNTTNLYGETLLHTACIHNSLDRVNALLSHPEIRVNEQDWDLYTPLSRACASGYLDIIKALLAHKDIDPNTWDAYNQTPLHAACIDESLDLVNMLLSHKKTNPNEPDIEGLTSLDRACGSGNIDIVKALLAHPKTRSDVPSADGLTPLKRARAHGYIEIEHALLAHKKAIINPPVCSNKFSIRNAPQFFQNRRKNNSEKAVVDFAYNL